MDKDTPFKHNLKCKRAFYKFNKEPNALNQFKYRQAKKDCPACYWLENNP